MISPGVQMFVGCSRSSARYLFAINALSGERMRMNTLQDLSTAVRPASVGDREAVAGAVSQLRDARIFQ